ncbi:MAG: dihydroorotate dehydrogenase electron transfer subunit [Candidatus Odinarchaeia archaeon]
MHVPRITKVEDVFTETETIKTIYFRDEKIAKESVPGQFIMVWIPGLDEIPMGISHLEDNNIVSITVENIGEATNKLCSLKKGDKIGVRGPYGNGFSTPGENNLIIGGGSGMAPLIPIIDRAVNSNKKVKVILGGKNSNKLPFLKYIEEKLSDPKKEFYITTEDGSYGYKGLVTDILIKLIKKENFEKIFAVGPELMIKAVYDILKEKELYLEVSLERYFKCGIGICGSCCIGQYRVCVDGPVFNISKLKNIENIFGKYTRDASGKKIELKK